MYIASSNLKPISRILGNTNHALFLNMCVLDLALIESFILFFEIPQYVFHTLDVENPHLRASFTEILFLDLYYDDMTKLLLFKPFTTSRSEFIGLYYQSEARLQTR